MKRRHKIFLGFIVLSVVAIAGLHFFPLSFYQYTKAITPKIDYISQWKGDDRPTLIYLMPPPNFMGETESMTSLLIAAKKMGWNLISEESSRKLPKKLLKNAFGLFINNPIIWTIYSKEGIQDLFPKDITIVCINNFVYKEHALNPNKYLDKLLNKKSFYTDPRIQGLLAVTFPEINSKKIEHSSSHLKFIMNWYLTNGATYYQPQLHKLMYCGALWDKRRSEGNYLKLWKSLDETDYFAVYGHIQWKNYKTYKGYIPADGKSFIEEIHKNGICLVLHSQMHLEEGVPSGRIFEAAAAAAVIISDKHPFVEREFKDSVLYIDESRANLFEQINAHMRWIKAHPEKAKEKARLAHAIFLQKFTQEQQLARLYEALHSIKTNSSLHAK